MKTESKSGIFGCPGGQVTVEVPDGVSMTMGDGRVHNSLTNSGYAHGGPDACGYGAFTLESNDGTGMSAVLFMEAKPKFRID